MVIAILIFAVSFVIFIIFLNYLTSENRTPQLSPHLQPLVPAASQSESV